MWLSLKTGTFRGVGARVLCIDSLEPNHLINCDTFRKEGSNVYSALDIDPKDVMVN